MTHPRPTPRAPIVWQDTRKPIRSSWLLGLGRAMSSTKSRAVMVPPDERPPHLPGQLWARLAELEVATHGAPRPSERRA